MRVTIEATDAGTFAVTTEAMDAMPEEQEIPALTNGMGSGLPQEQDAGQEVATLDEALELAREMLGGAEEPSMPLMEGESDFVGGFNSVRGAGL